MADKAKMTERPMGFLDSRKAFGTVFQGAFKVLQYKGKKDEINRTLIVMGQIEGGEFVEKDIMFITARKDGNGTCTRTTKEGFILADTKKGGTIVKT